MHSLLAADLAKALTQSHTSSSHPRGNRFLGRLLAEPQSGCGCASSARPQAGLACAVC